MKKPMRITEQIKLLKVVSGIAWIITGIFSCFENVVCSVIQLLAVIVSMMIVIRVSVAQKEYPDEMADENLCKAKAQTLDIMHIIFMAASIVAIMAILILGIENIALSWPKVIPGIFFFTTGVEDLCVGIAFQRLEAE